MLSFLVATNVIASWPPKRWPTGKPHTRANFPDISWDFLEICLRFAWDMHGICMRYEWCTWYIPEICVRITIFCDFVSKWVTGLVLEILTHLKIWDFITNWQSCSMLEFLSGIFKGQPLRNALRSLVLFLFCLRRIQTIPWLEYFSPRSYSQPSAAKPHGILTQ